MVLHPQINGMGFKTAKPVERYGKTVLVADDPVHPADDGGFHFFLCQKIGHRYMRPCFHRHGFFVLRGKPAFFLHQFFLHGRIRMRHQQVFMQLLHRCAEQPVGY